ncbi:MAG: glycosyltransferase family 4 protein [Pseudomonadota bacterium]
MRNLLAILSSRGFFGAERANLEVLDLMQRAGLKVEVLVRHEPWKENLHLRAQLQQRSLRWHTARFPDYPSMAYPKYWLRVLFLLPFFLIALNLRAFRVAHRQRSDVVLLNSVFSTICLLPWLWLSRLPSVFYVNSAPEQHNAFYRWAWKVLARRVNTFVGESDYIAGTLRDVGVPELQISVIRSQAPSRHQPQPCAWQRDEGDGLFVLGYVGQISVTKGLELLIESFVLLHATWPAVRLALAGPLDSVFAQQLKMRCEGLACASAIFFHGAVEDIDGFFVQCDAHVALSLGSEAYGLVVIEAKQAGCPSVVLHRGGIAELVLDGVDGFVVEEATPDAVTRQLLAYRDQPSLAAQQGREARASLMERLHTDRQAEYWRHVLERVRASFPVPAKPHSGRKHDV